MNYYSTNKKSDNVSFRETALNGLASDGGLYMPELIPVLPKDFLNRKNLSLHEIGFEVARKFIGKEINKGDLQNIVTESLNFIIPIFPLNENIFCMELFHGPTLAFKDVGARFMAHVLSHCIKNENRKITILTATSGDTGSAVANAFYEKEGIKVVILYPENGISEIQERQMTTLGKNISAVAINGTFDDCQRLVKNAFSDIELKKKLNLTSANSINIVRLIPQSFYYLYAYALIPEKENIVFSVPCGNFGNLTAGLIAKRMGMKATFIAGTNRNNVFTEYLQTENFSPRPSQKTISNAMDVGNPSNFARLLDLYDNDVLEMKKDILSFSISDEETRVTMRKVFTEKKYLLDPHGAVAFRALQTYSSLLPHSKGRQTAGVVLVTAHPAKFREVVEEIIVEKIILPEKLQSALQKEKSANKLPADFNMLREFLLARP